MLIACLCFVFVVFLLEAIYRTALLAFLWAPALFCGLWVGQAVQRLRLDDPLAPLWALIATTMLARLLLGRLAAWVMRRNWF